jgi:HD-like signal output (HDOD) protein
MNAKDLVQEVGTLFSLPDVVVRLNGLIESGNASTAELGEVVELDPGLAAAVLKLANSAWYGLPSNVDTMPAAVMLIGQKALRSLALSASVVKTFRGIPEHMLDMRAFWDRSIACGVIARNLGRACRIEEEERLFIASLLLCVGSHRAPLLAKAWPREAAVVFVAADMSGKISAHLHAQNIAVEYVPDFDPEIWNRLGIEASAIPEVIAESLAQAREVSKIVNPT